MADFYYLSQTKEEGISYAELRRDIERGVKRLSDYSYVRLSGSTRGSLIFVKTLIRYFGLNNINVKRAVLTFDKKHHYVATLYTREGYEIILTGVSGGYWGEGTRGFHDILKIFGFSEEQCQLPFKLEKFDIKKVTRGRK